MSVRSKWTAGLRRTRWACAALGVVWGSGRANAQAPKPPRTDGIYLGFALSGQGTWIRLSKESETKLHAGGGATLLVGEQVLDWLSLGLRVGFASARLEDRSGTLGWLQLEAGFYPLHAIMPPELQMSLRVRTGLGGGFVTVPQLEGRQGVGGAALGGAVRLEWFPWARCKRPREGGGLALSPELGVDYFPPSSSDGSWSVATQLSLSAIYHFGS